MCIRDRRAVLAPPASPGLAHPSVQPEAILVSMLDAPRAIGVLVRTFTGYALAVQYDQGSNTLVLTATPPAPKLAHAGAHAFGITALELLRDAQVDAAALDELGLAFTRRCALPCAPASPVVGDWPVQVVSTGAGDKTVCLQIEKAGARARSASAIIIC